MTRRTLAVALAISLAGCKFTFDRTVGPGEMRGQVVFDNAGTSAIPAVGARIVLENSSIAISADSNGRFIIPNLPPGNYAIDVTSPRPGSAVATTGLHLANLVLQPVVTVGGLGDGRDLGKVVVGDFGAVAGTVTNAPPGTAGAVALIGGTSAGGTVSGIAQTNVDETSAFAFKRMLPGVYQISVFAPGAMGSAVIATPVNVTIPPGGTQTVVIDLSQGTTASSNPPTGSISGIAQFSGASGSNSGIGIGLWAANVDPSVLPSNVTTQDATGDYSVPSIPPGIYSVTGFSGGSASVSINGVLVGAGTATLPTMTLSPLGMTPAGSTQTPAAEVSIACENEAICGATIFASEMACEANFNMVLSGLQGAGCTATLPAFQSLVACVATQSCTDLTNGAAICPGQFQQVSLAAKSDPSVCPPIVAEFGVAAPASSNASSIGPSGGTVSAVDGSGVSIPSGALTMMTSITITPSAPSTPTPANSTAVGPSYTFGPEGQQFAMPVTVTLAYSPALLPAGTSASDVVVFTAPLGSTAFTPLATTVTDDTHVQAQTTHFSVLQATVPPKQTSDAGPLTSDAGPITSDAGPITSDAGPLTMDAGQIPDAGCNVDSDCKTFPAVPFCDARAHFCVSCTSSAQCPTGADAGQDAGGATQVCEITRNSPYATSPTGAWCSSSTVVGMCADGGVGSCAALLPDQPLCNPSNGQCVQCLTGADCPADGGYLCNNGACAAACTLGLTSCSGTCVNVLNDPNNCGGCTKPCSAGGICTNGTCSICPTGAACGNTCSAPPTDPNNCGACGNVCPSGNICSGSACQACSAIFDGGPSANPAACAGSCTDLNSDPNNCGACGNACGFFVSCVNGYCNSVCTSDTECTNTPLTPHCDVIGQVCVACTSNAQCAAETDGGPATTCVISQNANNAGAACVGGNSYGYSCAGADGGNNFCANTPDQPICNPATGDCVQCLLGTDCPADGGYVCAGGGCVESCPSGTTNCSGTCADLNTDSRNCQTCGTACATNEVCTGGACKTCSAGTTWCDGFCADTGNDPANCGGCGVTCTSSQSCLMGVCVACPGEADGGGTWTPAACDNICTNLADDPLNCGSCGTICKAGQSCGDGSCLPHCTTNSDCASTPSFPACDVSEGVCVTSAICTTAQQTARLTQLMTSSIRLPNVAAGLDLAGFVGTGTAVPPLSPPWQTGAPETWNGLTVRAAQSINCQGTDLGVYFGNDYAISWGANEEVVLESGLTDPYVPIPDEVAGYIGLNFGYLGELDAHYTYDGGTTYYKIRLDGTPIQISTDGTSYTTLSSLDWTDAANGDATAMAPFDTLFRAIQQTYTDLPDEAQGMLCNVTGGCQVITYPGGAVYPGGPSSPPAVFFVPELNWAFWVQPFNTPTAAATPVRMDLYLTPLMSYSPLPGSGSADGGSGGGPVDGGSVPGAPASIQILSGASQMVPGGGATLNEVVVEVLDSASNPLSGVALTWTAQSAGTIMGTSPTNAEGQATATVTLPATVGSYNFTVSTPGGPTTMFTESTTCVSTSCMTPASCLDNCGSTGAAATACAQVQCNSNNTATDTCGNVDTSCGLDGGLADGG